MYYFFQIIVSIFLITALIISTEGSISAPAVAFPPPISYRQAIPYNVAPFAASISTFTKALSLPPVAPYSAYLPLPAAPAPFLPAPLAAAPAPYLPAPFAAARAPFFPGPALPAPLAAGPYLPTPFPLAARSIHPV